MSVKGMNNIESLLSTNSYPGRGIIIGQSADGKNAMIAYFIMGRSENSRNRIFERYERGMRTKAFDESKLVDPSLIIYNLYLERRNIDIITNGDQTDTIYDAIAAGGDMRSGLRTREFEPDAPNLTPRISGVLNFADGDFSYEMSILKSATPDGRACNRYFYEYSAINGLGHFIHTYMEDGNPLPTFLGEPERVCIGADIDEFANDIWNSLNPDNKISLYVKYIDLATGEEQTRLFNKNN